MSDLLDQAAIQEDVPVENLETVISARPDSCILTIRCVSSSLNDMGVKVECNLDKGWFRSRDKAIALSSGVEVWRWARFGVEETALVENASLVLWLGRGDGDGDGEEELIALEDNEECDERPEVTELARQREAVGATTGCWLGGSLSSCRARGGLG